MQQNYIISKNFNMNKLNQLVWRIADLTESYRKDLEPQHILISGVEGSGKTFTIEKLAEEFTARGFLMVKNFYPHSNIVILWEQNLLSRI